MHFGQFDVGFIFGCRFVSLHAIYTRCADNKTRKATKKLENGTGKKNAQKARYQRQQIP